MKTLQTLFINELSDIYDAEHRICKALLKMASAATNEDLKDAFNEHRTETQDHVTKLQEVFKCFDVKPKTKTCKATVGLLEEADEMAAEFKDSPCLDAALIAAAQKVEHYEIATYTTLIEWANLLDNAEAAELLGEILEEEQTASSTLREIAEDSCNTEAEGDQYDEDAAPAKAKSSPKTSAGRTAARAR